MKMNLEWVSYDFFADDCSEVGCKPPFEHPSPFCELKIRHTINEYLDKKQWDKNIVEFAKVPVHEEPTSCSASVYLGRVLIKDRSPLIFMMYTRRLGWAYIL